MLESITAWISANPISAITLAIATTCIVWVLASKLWNTQVSDLPGARRTHNPQSTSKIGKPPILTKMWKCNDCDTEYDTKKEAEDCCGPPGISYKCNACDEEYDTEKEALDCCKANEADVEEIEVWKCASCNEHYEDKDEARECCA